MVSPQVADILSQESVRPVKSLKSSIVEFPVRASTASSTSNETIESVVGNEAYQYSARFSEHFVKTSKVYSAKYEQALPKISSSEIEIGPLLGHGGFSDVFEIQSFCLNGNDEQEDEDQRDGRRFLKIHSHREVTGEARYAVKYLRQHILDDREMFILAAKDLALEAKLLCSVFHPNIIKLRGVCSEGEKGFRARKPDGFFLILDRLEGTLEHRIEEWKKNPEAVGINKKSGLKKFFSSKTVQEIPLDVLKIIRDIAAALKYLHRRNIIYRDLKPENFGFDIRGDIKLFDFGLSKDVSTLTKLKDGTYDLTGCTGSLRYMAPEVVKSMTYNSSVDVFSFSIMLWEMLTTQKPFDGFTSAQHSKLVAYGTYRPKIKSSFPDDVKQLLCKGWSSNLNDRPTFEDIYKKFSDMISSKDERNKRSFHSARRSTHVMLRNSQIKELMASKRMPERNPTGVQ